MTFTGLDAIRDLRRIQQRNEEIQTGFLERNQVLNQIRADAYLFGTYARDYLLDPEPGNAIRYAGELSRLRNEMEATLAGYKGLAMPVERAPLQDLSQGLAGYWTTLDPMFHWTPEQRREKGFVFLRDDVFPRRMRMLVLADQIQSINEQQMHAGGQRVAELFGEFRTRLSITLVVALALGGLLAAFSSRRILHLERQAAQRFQEVVEARGQLKSLSARLVQAQEHERRALSRELHDEVGQSLSASLIGLSNLSAAIRSGLRRQVDDELDALRRLVEGTVSVVRNITLLLRPSMLDDLGLVPALEWQAREVSRQSQLLVRVDADGVSEDLPESFKTCIYRVVQEALHNVTRHASAVSVRIAVQQEPDQLRLSIEDDGCGFQMQRTRGLGLLGMEERVVNLGGVFQIASQPGAGTRITIALPVAAARETPKELALT